MSMNAQEKVCFEIQEIAQEYRRQSESGRVDTPGGLEHTGDVWRLLLKWDEMLRTSDYGQTK